MRLECLIKLLCLIWNGILEIGIKWFILVISAFMHRELSYWILSVIDTRLDIFGVLNALKVSYTPRVS